MKRIEMDIYEPVPGKPGMVRHVGQRTAQEVFEELKHRLESTGYLPDEYFLLDSDWKNGREIPKDADIFCATDYGASEGIYLDIYLKWYDEEQKKNITESFVTGKTLGETDLDLDRMNLIASAVTKAFHSDGVHARYIRLGEPGQSDGCVMHLNGAERRLLIDSLVEKHGRLTEETQAVEQLLRRVTGSITEYINETGQRPMRLDDFDAAVLAIQDGNLPELDKIYKNIPDRTGELLVHAAGRPGHVGTNMTLRLIAGAQGVPNDMYFEACKKAIDTGDANKVMILADQAGGCRVEDDLSLYGDMIGYAMSGHRQHIAREILAQCTPQMIKEANPRVLVQALERQDYKMASDLVEGGIDANRYGAEIIHALTYKSNDRDYFNFLVKRGMEIDNGNYSAMRACIKTDSPEQAKLLLDRGMDFDLYTEWAGQNGYNTKDGETLNAVKEYWENEIKQADSNMTEDGQNNGQTMSLN
jgi:hypothetical protein